MPTPPPWGNETHVAPAAALSRALRIGQAAMAPDPSFMPSVSRFGEAARRAGVGVVAPDDDRRLHLLLRDEAVEEQPGLVALAVAEPADARGEALELDALLGHADPAVERGVVREKLEDRFVGGEEVRRIAAQRGPAERAFSFRS